ncbi:acyltransferase [Sulfurimonas sp. NW15]|uniref:acyltransferase family protein n=1 Tax=Sulfurimonas sp. NW15 TaxID=2922729 RepID=UPI003DA92E1D
MHGTLRFFLAIAVVLSHLNVRVYGYNPGVSAVVIFYLLAGMVAYKLNTRVYPNHAILYYKDRIKRVFPLYLMVLLFAYTVYLLGASSYFISKTPTFTDYIANITVIPLAYYMYTGQDTFTLIPPAWSLGVELQFYLLAPFILLSNRKILFLLISSFIIYLAAIFQLLNTDYFAYRLIVGVLFMFLTGALIEQYRYNQNKSKYTLVLLYVFLIMNALVIYYFNLQTFYSVETLFGLLIGIPILSFLFKPNSSKIVGLDRFLGNISYAVFLLHFPVIWLLKLLNNGQANAMLVLFVTIALSAIFFNTLYYLNRLALK